MKYLYIRLDNYIGVFNGQHKEFIEIDLSKAINKIILVSGANGSSKSTLLNAINILPDSNDDFVPLKTAIKYLKLTDGVNIYEITFVHPVDKVGHRQVTKVSLVKNGIELNPNGNVGTYKDIIFNEFDIDGNFLGLYKISSDNRGLSDKKPAERKKIMSSLISSLEAYNEIYKNLNKKTNIFKSHVNTLNTKIQSVGDEKLLSDKLIALSIKETALNNTINSSRDKIVEFKTLLSVNDKDGALQSRYDQLVNDLRVAENDVKISYNNLAKYKDSYSNEYDFDNIEDQINKNIELINRHSQEMNDNNSKIQALIININSVQSDIDKLNIRIEKLSVEVDTTLDENISLYESKISSIKEGINLLGLKDINAISSDEIDRALAIFDKIVRAVDSIYELTTSLDLHEIYSGNVLMKYNDFINIESNTKDKINDITNKLNILKHDLEIVKVLDNRPKKCKDDTCSFIKSALDIINSYGGVDSLANQYENLQQSLDIEKETLDELQNMTIPRYKHLLSVNEIFDGMINMIKDNERLLSKFTISSRILDIENLYKLICETEYRFNEFRDVTKYMDLANSIIEYKSITGILTELYAKQSIQKNNIQLLSDYKSDLEEKNNNLTEYKSEYDKLKKDNEFLQGLCDQINSRISILNGYNEKYIDWESKNNILNEMRVESEKIKESFKSSLELLDSIAELEELIVNTTNELNPVIDEKKNLDSQLLLLQSFKSEYAMYKDKYDFVSKLRDYSSPTSGSIQSLFMSIYMDKTLDMVNQILGMLFNGEYQILQYVINEDEFRIPFIGNGMAVDDISSGSTSQVCMMGMIINLVLADMCSSKYNIVTLDEVDSGLDQYNKYMFTEVLNKISDILNIEQLFIISHSIESSMSNVDVILTSNSQDYKDLFSNVNIIYQPN